MRHLAFDRCEVAPRTASAAQTVIVFRMLCSSSELDEDGEVIAVGEAVSRSASRGQSAYYGTDLDTVEWHFDQYADLVGPNVATVSGQVIAISAVYVNLTAVETGWTARPGSAHLEPLDSTALTRRVRRTVHRGSSSEPDEHGHSYRTGYPLIEEGNEHLSGWVFTLATPQINPYPSA